MKQIEADLAATFGQNFRGKADQKPRTMSKITTVKAKINPAH